MLSAGTASASLPRRGVCRRCPQRTVLVDPPFQTTLRGLRTRAGAALTRPTENHCSRRTRKATPAIHRTKKKCFSFSRSHHPPLTRTSEAVECGSVEHILLQLTVVNVIPVKEIRGDSWGRKGLGETPQSDERNIHRISFELRGALLHRNYLQRDEHHSTRRLSSRPRKA